MMPIVDGLSVCRALRRNGDKTPVLILTAKHEVTDRVAGLDAGADDYLVKPFSLDELLARIRALLKTFRRPGRALTGNRGPHTRIWIKKKSFVMVKKLT